MNMDMAGVGRAGKRRAKSKSINPSFALVRGRGRSHAFHSLYKAFCNKAFVARMIQLKVRRCHDPAAYLRCQR